MKKQFRYVSILTGAAIMASSLAGCGNSVTTSDTATTTTQTTTTTTTTTETTIATDTYDSGSEAEYTEAEYPVEAAPMAPQETGRTSTADAVTGFFSSNKNSAATAEGCYIYEDYWDDSYCPVPYNNESYDKPEENGFFLSQVQPLSTFAADVDTASYANIRRMIESGYGADRIDPEAVRPEEFINYFSYDLNSPKRGEKFGVTTEVSTCLWNKDHQLMFVGLKAEDKFDGDMPKSNLVFLIDVSGSMTSEDKLPLLQKAFKELVDNLPGDGTVSIVTYASREEVVLSGEKMSNKRAIKNAISRLSAGGSTAGERGMQMAYEIAAENFIEGGNNRVIMATDGDLNVGISDPDDLEDFISEKKDSGIYLSVLGFGTGNYKDDKLERLADCGNGNYSYIDSMTEARKVLVDEMSSTLVTVAKDVKFQVEFNPATVNAYRLIGYENRQMDAVDFNNDAKDGGEIGAGHTVVALYEIIPAGSKSAIDLKYQTAANSDSDDYATIKIRYKEPDEDKSNLLTYVVDEEFFNEQAGENLAFASLVSEFAMLIGDSDYTGDITYSDIMKAYKKLDNTDDYKDEFYNLVRMVEKRS
ncbi:vWA domain-containing protein [Butyrivibrio sp. FCS014]|uniref:vWA domain-containing protein n=1 Tax=Butyrivibrio sp. FCS014 TaxID=1408304 RepID=UPI000463C4C4|nr:VWA domain-containing protein [Butyrivibrio sp. FCS014]